MVFVASDDPWEDAGHARRYAEFARRYPMYRLTSGYLVGLAALGADARVVDLCCGTGVTTEAVLAVLGARGSVVAVDGAAAMLAEARSRVADERVRWLQARAEDLAAAVTAGADAVVSNQAFWQADMPAAAAAARGVLREGGRLGFNVPAHMLAGRPEAAAAPDVLITRAREMAAREHGWPAPGRRRDRARPGRLSDGAVRGLLARAGFMACEARELRWEQSLEERYAWLQLPVFSGSLQRALGGLPYPQCRTLLARAYRHVTVTRPEPRTAVAVTFIATAGPVEA